MVFKYPVLPHERRHGPEGYVNYQSFKDWLRDDFCFQCVYCLFRERWYPTGHAAFSVDHILPQSKAPHLATLYDNLAYACLRCNSYKREISGLVDPCGLALGRLLRVSRHGRIMSNERDGMRLIRILDLDGEAVTAWRRDLIEQHSEWTLQGSNLHDRLGLPFRFPKALPDVSRLRPKHNSRPKGVVESWFARKQRGVLPTSY